MKLIVKKALNAIRNEGIDIMSILPVAQGINSQVYRLTDSQKKCYALKFYQTPTEADPRNRRESEERFLVYMNECDLKFVPRLITISQNKDWSLLRDRWKKAESSEHARYSGNSTKNRLNKSASRPEISKTPTFSIRGMQILAIYGAEFKKSY